MMIMGSTGILLVIKKIKNSIRVYKFTSILDDLSDSSLTCKAANGYLFSKWLIVITSRNLLIYLFF